MGPWEKALSAEYPRYRPQLPNLGRSALLLHGRLKASLRQAWERLGRPAPEDLEGWPERRAWAEWYEAWSELVLRRDHPAAAARVDEERAKAREALARSSGMPTGDE